MSNAYVLARRQIVLNAGRATAALAAIGLAPSSAAAAPSAPAGALKDLTDRLASAPRRRNFKTVPLIVTEHRDWDHEAAAEVMAYRYKSRQVWDNSDLSGPWPGLMRESMNGHVFALGYSDFLAVSATHGEAHLALFSQGIWDKYNLADLVGRKFASNTLIVEHDGVSLSDDLQNPQGFYGPMNNNIVSLQGEARSSSPVTIRSITLRASSPAWQHLLSSRLTRLPPTSPTIWFLALFLCRASLRIWSSCNARASPT
jgi:hypothetical protein